MSNGTYYVGNSFSPSLTYPQVEKLCVNYGQLIGTIGSVPYYDFPSPAALIGSTVEPHLRQLGFGYRAKYLHQTAVTIVEHGSVTWLNQLRNPESPAFGQVAKAAGEMKEGGRTGYREAHEQLLDLSGVGPKVADCVCLMGLGWGEAVPVDTHVWQIAQRDYKFGKGKHKSLTTDTYNAIGNHFRRLWGKEAGWAHSVLFTADLKAFSGRLTSKVEVTTETVVKNDSSEVVKSKAMVKVEYKTERKIKSEIDMENDVVEVPESARTQRAKRRKTS
ncbi:MAG: 8-oxoguanine glycosylase ogg1 [Piccolia ochrophora]|nr:MAG: 8-oxoguanine glycosylase ogg1 [Piccolia ochrophora]